jgi:hypothetical protein
MAAAKPSSSEVKSAERSRAQSLLPPGIFVMLAISAFYAWTTTSSHTIAWGAKQTDYFNQLSEGILSGHLYLAQQPPRELLVLKDPLDPVANRPYRVPHDASLYNGHYYVYFAPTCVFTFFLPWRAITGSGIPIIFGILLYMLAGYVFSCILFFLLMRASDVRLSWLHSRAAVVALGLCQTAPLLMRATNVYETAIAAAYCFFMGGMYFLARSVIEKKPVRRYAILAGLFLGLTPGCRPNYVVVVTVVCGLYFWYLWRSTGLRGRDLLRRVMGFGIPIVVCGGLLAWYNWVRFGNPLETGQSYQLAGDALDRGLGGSVGSFLPSIYKLLFEPPLAIPHFPFFELVNHGPFGSGLWPPGTNSMEWICGLLIISPVCIAGLMTPFFVRRVGGQLSLAVRFTLIALGVSSAANLVGIAMVVRHAAQRYELDFAPALLICSLFILCYLATKIESVRTRRVAAGVLIGGLIMATAEQTALSINSNGNELIRDNSAQFNRLASLFGDDEKSVRRYVFGVSLDGEVAFPSHPGATHQALLTTGVPGQSNAVFVEYLREDRIRIGYFAPQTGIDYGPEIPIVSGKRYRLSVLYLQSVNTLNVTIDDALVLLKPTYFYPTSFREATVGRNDLDIPSGIAPFSGDLKVRLQFAAAAPPSPVTSAQ